MKALLQRLATSRAVVPILLPLANGVASVLMLHRFADPDAGVEGHDPALLADCLEFLRRHRYRLRNIAELVDDLVCGRSLGRTVVFTVDDGYADFAHIAAPVFVQFDCPVTVFVTTGFLDGATWMWWDQLDCALRTSGRSELAVDFGDGRITYALGVDRRRAIHTDLIARLKRMRDADMRATVLRIAADLEVELPGKPSARWAPMNWEQVRRCGQRGVTFGPHSVTHPILSRLDEAACAREVADSWRHLKRETEFAVPVFCYPNGEASDYGQREIRVLQTAGLAAAVSTRSDYVRQRGETDRLFALPRFGWPDDRSMFVRIVSGVERLRRAL